jgi:c-di-GMP-related signal transduction protein
MDRPMQDILSALPLAEEVNHALLDHEGLCGAALHAVLAYERGNWAPVKALNLDSSIITEAYLQALTWTADYETML